MQAFHIIRLAVFGVVLAFALIILGLGANIVVTFSAFGFYSSVPAFAVATGVLTFAILVPVLVIDFLRKGAITSLTASELGFMGFLWILWLSCASNMTARQSLYYSEGCSSSYDPETASYCQQFQALQAFSWLGWLVLFFYWIALLVIALIAQSRGVNNAFMTPSTDLATNLPAAGTAGGEPKIPPANYPPGGMAPGTYPPQGPYPQQSQTPGQYTAGYNPPPMASQGHAFQPSYASSPAPPPANTIHV
jgi:hypothetical protein